MAAALLAGCGNLENLNRKAREKRRLKELEKLAQTSTAEARSRLGEKAAGEIAYADSAGGFVLIRSLTGVTIPPGTELECLRDGSVAAKVTTTPEKKGHYVAADVVSGSPAAGDSVVPVGGVLPPPPVPVANADGTPAAAQPAAPAGSSAANPLIVDPDTIRPEDLPDTIGNIMAPELPQQPPDSLPPGIPPLDER
jgi:hypothetical protein